MKRNKLKLLWAATLAAGIAAAAFGQTGTDLALNGTWEHSHGAGGMGTVRYVFDDGTFLMEALWAGRLERAERRTFTSTVGTITMRPTHFHRAGLRRGSGPEWVPPEDVDFEMTPWIMSRLETEVTFSLAGDSLTIETMHDGWMDFTRQ